MIIYLHGFGSSGNTDKAHALIKRFGAENVWNPDLPVDPLEVRYLINNWMRDWLSSRVDNERIVIVGTSLGGFYTTYFSLIWDCPGVIVNPSIVPDVSLSKYIGKNVNQVTQEEFILSLANLEELSRLKDVITRTYESSVINLFLAEDDEVIDYQKSVEFYKYYNSLTITPDGGHRYTEHWDKVVDKVAELYYDSKNTDNM